MATVYYEGNPGLSELGRWRDLPKQDLATITDPRGYLPAPDMVDAVNVALELGQPLLVTGEPGTGKTQLAYSVAFGAWIFNSRGECERFKVRDQVIHRVA